MATRALRLQSWCDEQEERVHTLKGRESQSIHVVHFPQVSVCSDVKKKKKKTSAGFKGTFCCFLFCSVLFFLQPGPASAVGRSSLWVSQTGRNGYLLATNNTPTNHLLVYDC